MLVYSRFLALDYVIKKKIDINKHILYVSFTTIDFDYGLKKLIRR